MKSYSWKISGLLLFLFVVGLLTWLTPTSAPAGQRSVSLANTGDDPAGALEFMVSDPVLPTISPALRDLPLATDDQILDREINPRHNPLLLENITSENIQNVVDPLLGLDKFDAGRTPLPILSFDGLINTSGVTPPDTVGDVGLNHYVQAVNATRLIIYDKSGNVLVGPIQMNDLWPSGGCAASNSGDPIVVYDGLADRWVIAQFRSGFANGFCVAVSQTPDATGSYYGYEFSTPDFPDYFKIGVWPDAYYIGSNESAYSAYALNRDRMLQGLSATFQRFTGQTNFILPADIDGPTLPPAGAPGYFYTYKDNTFHGGTDRLEIFAFDVDWVTPANSTFTIADTLLVAPYTYTVCGFFVLNCIDQPATTQDVDPVSEWPMWRLAYRNFGGYETMVANFAIDVGGDLSGIRWYELRKSGADWTIYQEGTHSPDSNHRWMGSIAMDKDGNMALGYNVSNNSDIFPSIRYVTRLAGDPLNSWDVEQTLITGGGSQTGSNRWGDYSAMSVDPADDCTFWFTGEYYTSSSSTSWRTRIGTFKIPTCGQGGGTPTPTSQPPTATPTVEPPTATPTSQPPTATPTVEPPTATPTSVPDDDFYLWLPVVIDNED